MAFDWGGLVGALVPAAADIGGKLIVADAQQNVANTNKQIAANNLAAEQARIASQERIAKMVAQNQSQAQTKENVNKESGFSISPTTGLLIGGGVLLVGIIVVVVVSKKKKAPPAPNAPPPR
jgi:hypothetical protein